jgi:hypothetical protein
LLIGCFIGMGEQPIKSATCVAAHDFKRTGAGFRGEPCNETCCVRKTLTQ